MEDNYLVIVGAYINNEYKKNLVVNLVNSLKDENIDVCLSVHSKEHLSEIANLSNYIVYDSNNEFIYSSDFFNNADLLTEDRLKYGHIYYYTNYSFGEVSYNLPHTYHSKAALSLLRNGISIAYSNRYKWVIYIEYDIPIPNDGYKKFIENNIIELKKDNKKCLYYRNELPGIDFLWGGVILFDTDTIFQSVLLMQSEWIKSSREWIKTWGLSFFEYCIQSAINEKFKSSEVLTKSIINYSKKYWGVDDYRSLSKSHGDDFTIIKDNVFIHILPAISTDGIYELYLFMTSKQSKSILEFLKVEVDNNIVLEFNNKELPPDHWFLNKILFGIESKYITLTYKMESSPIQSEKFETMYLENIYKNIARIKWKVEV